ncbi:7,8-didemethyl-8-hydroxy-5-deazariboflavin synthase subunit CofG [Natrialbaceae archaeon A-chndr2]
MRDRNLSLDDYSVEALLSIDPSDVTPPSKLTFARNVFVPLTTACRYTCTYCTYFDPPGQASLLSVEEVREICRYGFDAGCTEALFTFGDTPDSRYTEIHKQLNEWGFDSIHTYLREACEVALEEGLLPHSNPGDQTKEQMSKIADVNASMGVMLETTANVDAHTGPRKKTPAKRLQTIRNAGELNIAFTTGILVGIGETWSDRAESLLAIRELHNQYDHIQEVIIQPVVENKRWSNGSPGLETMRRVTSMARVALPEEISIQSPPNLAPVSDLIDCGVDDLGGVSPVTDDHINPTHKWPALRELKEIANGSGLPLYDRLPVHERFLSPDLLNSKNSDGNREGSSRTNIQNSQWISPTIRAALTADDNAGERYRAVLRESNPVASSSK